jgi:hypothetical protein
LSQANVTVRLKDGRVFEERADGARGYPDRISAEELATKFMACARRSLTESAAERALAAVRTMESIPNVSELTKLLVVG